MNVLWAVDEDSPNHYVVEIRHEAYIPPAYVSHSLIHPVSNPRSCFPFDLKVVFYSVEYQYYDHTKNDIDFLMDSKIVRCRVADQMLMVSC